VTDDHTTRAGGERPLTDDERAKLYREQVKRLHTVDLLRALLADVVTLAYQKLGLTPETADMRDLGDVRVAIETVRRLVEVLDAEGAADEARTYRSTLAALQLQFAAAAAPEADPGAPAAGSGPVRPAAAAASETSGGPEPVAGRRSSAKHTLGTETATGEKAPHGRTVDGAQKSPPATKSTAARKSPATKSTAARKTPATKSTPAKKAPLTKSAAAKKKPAKTTPAETTPARKKPSAKRAPSPGKGSGQAGS
jgi:hypothetical protein